MIRKNTAGSPFGRAKTKHNVFLYLRKCRAVFPDPQNKHHGFSMISGRILPCYLTRKDQNLFPRFWEGRSCVPGPRIGETILGASTSPAIVVADASVPSSSRPPCVPGFALKCCPQPGVVTRDIVLFPVCLFLLDAE